MRKDERNAILTGLEIERNKMISKVRYKIEQYFGVTALHQGAGQARFTTLVKEGWDRLCHAMAFNFERSCGDQETGSCSCDLGTGVSEVWELPRGRGEDQAANTAAIHDS
jgi:hypothetical protein